jgi:sulfur-oxidizing protein SoxX
MNLGFPLRSLVGAVLCASLLAACGGAAKREHERGFFLPEGDAAAGETAFVALSCHRCHSVEGVSLPDRGPDALPPIHLGGAILKVKSYGELVTSIVHPDHQLSPQYLQRLSPEAKASPELSSPMPLYHEEMNVRQLLDIVAFLHARYRLIQPTRDEYFYMMPMP